MGIRDFLRRAFASPGDDDGDETTGYVEGSGTAATSGVPAHPGPTASTGPARPPRQGGSPSGGGTHGGHGRHPLSSAELREALLLRLVSVDSLPSVEGLPHLRAIAPGVVEVLTFDFADRIVVPPADHLAALGTTEELVRLGRDHLRALIGPRLQRREVHAEDGLTFCFAHGDDYATSSLALVMPAVLDRLEPRANQSRGVALAVPDRAHLAYRTIEGLESVMALGPMAAFARNGYDDGNGPISPEVYWARGPRLDQWEQLTRQSEDGIEIHVPAALTALVEED